MKRTFLRRVFSVLMVLCFVFAQSGVGTTMKNSNFAVAAVGTPVLTERINFAQDLYDNAVVGEAAGNYSAASKTRLQGAIDDAEFIREYFSDDQDSIDSGVINLNGEIIIFQESAISEDEADSDSDGKLDVSDNCSLIANPEQEDIDEDGLGDACDPDQDDDGILNAVDNCPLIETENQDDLDDDGIGDECDPDADGDGLNYTDDNCEWNANPDQVDSNDNGTGDDCEDTDGDEKMDTEDNCPLVANANQADDDEDGIGNACDTFNGPDTDGDGVADANDNCPLIANPDQADENDNDVGDVCESSGDNDDEDETDTTNPVIQLLGDNPVSIFVGETYTDAGATANDDTDGDLTDAIEVDNSVDTSVAGTYQVTYDVSDEAGNEANQVARTVNVVERQSSGGGGSAVIFPRYTPADASVIINSGNERTASRNVALALKAEKAVSMAISNVSNFADGSSWEDFQVSKEWVLTAGNGTKTVYVKFKNAGGIESSVFPDSIILGEQSDGTNNNEEGGSVRGANTMSIADGDIIQCKSSSDPNAVYVVKIVAGKTYIRHLSAAAFKSYKNLKWRDLIQVNSLEDFLISKWVRVNTGAKGIAKTTDKVYEINGDLTKHWLHMDKEQFYARGGSEEAIFRINTEELETYIRGADVMP